MQISTIEEKLGILRSQYPTETSKVSSTEEALRRNVARVKLAENEDVRSIIEDAKRVIADINFLLVNDEVLSQEKRAALFAERKVHVFWLSRFDGEEARAAIQVIGETVDMLIK